MTERDEKRITCACCGKVTFPAWDVDYVCPECHWMGDTYQEEHPDEGGLENTASLNTARALYRKYGTSWLAKFNGKE